MPKRGVLADLIVAGTAPARLQTHARVLLKADPGVGGVAWPDARIAAVLGVGERTVVRVRARWADQPGRESISVVGGHHDVTRGDPAQFAAVLARHAVGSRSSTERMA